MSKAAPGIIDETTQYFMAEELAKESTRAKLESSISEAVKYSRMVLESDMHDFEKQSGNQLLTTVFESRLKKIFPSMDVLVTPLTVDQAAFCKVAEGSNTRGLYRICPDNSREFVVGYQDQGIIPEFSIILMRPKIVPNTEKINPAIADFPRAHWNDTTHRYDFEGPTPWEKKSYEPSGQLVGWRTILARLVLQGICTPAQVEKEFGIANRASWAVRMGRQQHDLPI